MSVLNILVSAERVASNETSLASLLVTVTAGDYSKDINITQYMTKATNFLGKDVPDTGCLWT